MTRPTRETFRAAGLSHLTAVSGWNVALVAGLVVVLGRRGLLARPVRLGLSVPIIWGFAWIVGFEPSVVRAALMASLALVAEGRGRPRDALTAVVWATVLMVLISPEIRHHPGFQLSVAVTTALTLMQPAQGVMPRWADVVMVAVVCQLAAAPLLLYHFGSWSLVAPLANLLAAPLIPLVMVGAVGVLLGSLVHPLLADLFGVLTWVPGRLVMGIGELAMAIPGSGGTTLTLSGPGVVLAYALLLALWFVAVGRHHPYPAPAEALS